MCDHGGQTRVLDPLHGGHRWLVVSYLIQVLGTELRSSVKAVPAFDC